MLLQLSTNAPIHTQNPKHLCIEKYIAGLALAAGAKLYLVVVLAPPTLCTHNPQITHKTQCRLNFGLAAGAGVHVVMLAPLAMGGGGPLAQLLLGAWGVAREWRCVLLRVSHLCLCV